MIPTELQRFSDRVEFDFHQPTSVTSAFELMGLVAPQIFPLMECKFLSFDDWMRRIDAVSCRWGPAEVLHAKNFPTKAAAWFNSMLNVLGWSYPNIVRIAGELGTCQECKNVIFPSFESKCNSCGVMFHKVTSVTGAAEAATRTEVVQEHPTNAEAAVDPQSIQDSAVVERANQADFEISAAGEVELVSVSPAPTAPNRSRSPVEVNRGEVSNDPKFHTVPRMNTMLKPGHTRILWITWQW